MSAVKQTARETADTVKGAAHTATDAVKEKARILFMQMLLWVKNSTLNRSPWTQDKNRGKYVSGTRGKPCV